MVEIIIGLAKERDERKLSMNVFGVWTNFSLSLGYKHRN
jgi:hypothetical protein